MSFDQPCTKSQSVLEKLNPAGLVNGVQGPPWDPAKAHGSGSEFFRLILKLRFVRRNRGLIRARAACQVSDIRRVQVLGKCGSHRIFSW